ncbi:glutamate cyclase domain-containing protein [Gemmata sp.]|uniref:glutamate cyclase domain-containing protein n=1 Tax=Gemmata sp. TaxID=1914242 RepID=UPI003F713D5C
MTTDEKLAAILAAVQTDPGNRGLARDPHDNLFTATAGDFEAACRVLTRVPRVTLSIITGFFIPTATPPAPETDGLLGAVFLASSLPRLGDCVIINTEPQGMKAVLSGLRAIGIPSSAMQHEQPNELTMLAGVTVDYGDELDAAPWHFLALERAGPASDGRAYSMRGRDISDQLHRSLSVFSKPTINRNYTNLGIGDGGNEIGMGKIPHETVVKNIPNGDLIHCRVPTDHLIVAGVSNWGAYALAAGVYVLREVKPPADLFDPDREREILEVMVRAGPLVDGVTGQQTATVDGLPWDEYARPLVRIREILES